MDVARVDENPAAPLSASLTGNDGGSEEHGSYPRWLVAGTVPRVRWDDPALNGYLRRGEPVVITGGCPLTAPLVGRWSHEYLAEHYSKSESIMAHFAPRHVHKFNR